MIDYTTIYFMCACVYRKIVSEFSNVVKKINAIFDTIFFKKLNHRKANRIFVESLKFYKELNGHIVEFTRSLQQ